MARPQQVRGAPSRCARRTGSPREGKSPRGALHYVPHHLSTDMNEDNQRQIPEAFILAHTPAGRQRPALSKDELLERHELCEDLAQMLLETAQSRFHEMGITEADVLRTIRDGLPATDLLVHEAEISWVIGRIAELAGWLDENGQPPSD